MSLPFSHASLPKFRPQGRARGFRLAGVALAVSLLLGGCGLLDSRYERPAVQVPMQWNQGQPADAAALSGPWWLAFGDAELNQLIEQALARCQGNISQAARMLGVSRGLLYRRLREWGRL